VRPVSIGPTDGPMAAVNSGLSIGERVVVDGTDRLRDGARVTVPGAPGQAPAGKGNASPNARPQSPDRPHNRQNSGSQ
jgi:multidrug efflux system membrane fusion protein